MELDKIGRECKRAAQTSLRSLRKLDCARLHHKSGYFCLAMILSLMSS